MAVTGALRDTLRHMLACLPLAATARREAVSVTQRLRTDAVGVLWTHILKLKPVHTEACGPQFTTSHTAPQHYAIADVGNTPVIQHIALHEQQASGISTVQPLRAVNALDTTVQHLSPALGLVHSERSEVFLSENVRLCESTKGKHRLTL